MGFGAIDGVCFFSNINGWSLGIFGLESDCNIIELYCFNVNTEHGNEYSHHCKILTAKKRIGK